MTVNTPQPLPGGFQSATVILDGSGNGTASLGPMRVREHWQLAGAAVSVDSQTNEATCSIYVGPQAAQPYFISQSIQGSTGDTCSLAGMDIQPGQFVIAVWLGGDPFASAFLNLAGTYSIGAPA